MNTSDRTNPGGAWPDADLVTKLANELFASDQTLRLSNDAPAQALQLGPSSMDRAIPAVSPFLPNPALGRIEIPGEQELLRILASIPDACAAVSERSTSFLRSGATLGSQTPTPTQSAWQNLPSGGSAPALSAPFDVNAIRRDFPALREQVNGRPLVWLDNAATTQKPQAVIDRLKYFYEHENSNVHRAAHDMAARATDAYEGAREKVRAFLNAESIKECIFVRGTTEAINLVANTWGRQNIGKDDEIIVSWLEHHANIVPWQRLADERGARLRVIPVDDRGQLILEEYYKLLGPKTKLVAFTQVSNALGTITPAKQIVHAAHQAGAVTLVDGAQSVSHMPVDVRDLNTDFFVFSGHKLYGPTGIGVVYGKDAILQQLPPWQSGGNMIADVTFERTQYQPSPQRFEAGTGSIADAIGLGAAIDYVQAIGLERIAAYEHQLLLYATRLLQNIPGLRLLGTAVDKASVLSFVLEGHTTDSIGEALNREGIAVRSGHHCAQPILRRFGVESTVRPSLAFYNTCADIDALVSIVGRIAASTTTL